MDKSLRNHALVHEGVHSLQFGGGLCEKLLEEELSKEEVRQLQSEMNKNEKRLEGATEAITHFLDPESQKVGRRFYPDEMALVESELEPDSEISKDIKTPKTRLSRSINRFTRWMSIKEFIVKKASSTVRDTTQL